MKLNVLRSSMPSNHLVFLRRAGYAYIESRRTGQGSFVRRLTGNDYPRLHMYVEEEGDNLSFNLHLDQKQASYAGSHAHSGEYNSSIVEGEIMRLKSLLGIM
jgi:hypothetical protein